MRPEDLQKIVSGALDLDSARQQLETLEERLSVSEERFRALVEATSDWIWETDADFVCTYSNPKILDVAGYTPEEVIGSVPLDFMLAKEAHFLRKGFRTVRETGQPFHQFELPCRHKSGRPIVLEISGVPIPAGDGTLRGWRGVTRDITRKAEEARQQEILEDVINQNNALVIVWRMEPDRWPVEFISENCEKILGYAREDFLSGRVSWPDITHPDDNPRLDLEVAEHLEQGDKKWVQEYRLITKLGEIRWFRDSNFAFGGQAGGITRIQAIVSDITELKNIEEERRQVSNRIRQAREDEKKGFASALHDAIGAMVVGLSSSLLIVQEEIRHGNASRASAKLTQTRKLLKEVAAMMKQLCVDIIPPALGISGLTGAVSELVSRFYNRTGIKTLHKINLPDDWEKRAGQMDMVVYRVAQEALSNAAKYAKAKKLEFVMDYDDYKVTLTVSDNGRGFNVAKVKSKKQSYGLKIIAEDVEAVGGLLTIDSKPGRGTVIKAEFPRKRKAGGGDEKCPLK